MANPTKSEGLFRKEALEKLSSPEQLDQLMHVIKPRSWLMLACLGSLVGVGLVWSIWGRIPVRVSAQAVFIYPYQIREVQASGTGRIQQMKLRVGDRVRPGDVLGVIELPELEKQIQQLQAKLRELQQQTTVMGSNEAERDRLALESMEQQRLNLQRQIRNVESLLPTLEPITPTLKQRQLDAIRQQQINLQARLADAQRLNAVLKTRFENRRKLFEQGVLPQDTVLEAEQTYLGNLRSISELQGQLSQLQVQLVQVERTFIEDRNQLLNIQTQRSDLQRQLQDLDTKVREIRQRQLETAAQRQTALQDTQRQLNVLMVQLRQQSQIRSSAAGKILELPIKPGQTVTANTQIGLIATSEQAASLQGLALFPVQDGKKIQPGMVLQITPASVKRERFGGIEATVTSVTEFPMTKQEMAALIGNTDVVQSLGNVPMIGVYSQLKVNQQTFSGYQWSSSQGPQLKLTPGTPATASVTIENRSPISFVFPILREVTGLY
jgi:HlyD family secretion protein